MRSIPGAEPPCVEEDGAATATASNESKDADDPARVREYRPDDLADVQEDANRVMAFYPVDEEARRKMEAEVDLGYRMAAGVSVRRPAADSLFHDAAYLVASARPASPVPAGLQLSSADRLADTKSNYGAVRGPGEGSN